MKFTDLDLNADILDALQDLGYETPTPIQQQALPAALASVKDWIAQRV